MQGVGGRDEYLNKLQIAWRLILNLYGTYEALLVHALAENPQPLWMPCERNYLHFNLSLSLRLFATIFRAASATSSHTLEALLLSVCLNGKFSLSLD
jgi:hypothetical protein